MEAVSDRGCVHYSRSSAWFCFGNSGGKFLLVGPDWKGQKPDGFIDILRMPTNIAGVFPRSFTARTPEAKAKAVAVLNQIGMYPLSKNQPGQLTKDCQAFARNAVYPPGVTPQMIAADPDASRQRPQLLPAQAI